MYVSGSKSFEEYLPDNRDILEGKKESLLFSLFGKTSNDSYLFLP